MVMTPSLSLWQETAVVNSAVIVTGSTAGRSQTRCRRIALHPPRMMSYVPPESNPRSFQSWRIPGDGHPHRNHPRLARPQLQFEWPMFSPAQSRGEMMTRQSSNPIPKCMGNKQDSSSMWRRQLRRNSSRLHPCNRRRQPSICAERRTRGQLFVSWMPLGKTCTLNMPVTSPSVP